MIIYMAEPIDQAPPPPAQHPLRVHQLLMVVEDLLTKQGCLLYSPKRAWECGAGPVPDPRVEGVNRHALGLSDALVAYLPKGVPTIGVPMEIEAATSRGIPTLVITDVDSSFALAGRPGVSLGTTNPEVRSWVSRLLSHTPPGGKPEDHPGRVLKLVMDPTVDHQVETRAHSDDAGIDLVTSAETMVGPRQFVDIPTTVESVELPPDTWGMITGRSSTLRKYNLHVPVSVIDPGWRGPLLVGVYNLGDQSVVIRVGQRIGQIVLLHNRTMETAIRAVEPETLTPHQRGTNGFGSTGA